MKTEVFVRFLCCMLILLYAKGPFHLFFKHMKIGLSSRKVQSFPFPFFFFSFFLFSFPSNGNEKYIYFKMILFNRFKIKKNKVLLYLIKY